MNENRLLKIDLLRFLGIALIVLAHVNPPTVLFELRNFDVPLMVLLAGASYSLSFKKENYAAYVWKRIKRLVFPVWSFLTFFFAAFYVMACVTHRKASFPAWKTIASTYALLDGIGYVWIIGVLLLVALAAPILRSLSRRYPKTGSYFLVLCMIFFCYKFLYLFAARYSYTSLISKEFFTAVPYCLLFAAGMRFLQLNMKHLIVLLGLSTVFFFLQASVLHHEAGRWVGVQKYKYPPMEYYLFYAFAASCFVWILASKIPLGFYENRYAKPMILVGQNSIWFYLWHIPFAMFLHVNYALKYLVVSLMAYLLCRAQIHLVGQHVLPRISSTRLQRNIRTVFTG